MNTTTREGLLAEEKRYLFANIVALRETYPDRFLVIKGSKVHGDFANCDEAVDFGIASFGKGPFLVRSVSEPRGAVLSIPSLMAGIPLTAIE
ncbi:MAG: hypothetical protein F4Y33_14280 [Gemmatimonadales bacterium]|nr:hypothetical protein [Gemmatimonadales bacterium]